MVLVSIIIPTYNRWQYLQRAIESVLNQTFTDFECIIINDASTQAEYKEKNLPPDSRLKIIHLPVNMRKLHGGPHAQGLTRNKGIKEAQGKYLAFLDDDDWWEPQKLEIQLSLMGDYKMSCTNCYMHVNNVQKLYFTRAIPQVLKGADIECVNLVINSSVLIEKDIVIKVGLFRHVIYEDYDLWKRVLKEVDCRYIDKPLVHYDGNHGDGIYYNV